MNTHDFLKKQIDQQLQAEGITDRVSFQVAEEALDFYKRTAQFKRGTTGESLSWAASAKEVTNLNGDKRRA